MLVKKTASRGPLLVKINNKQKLLSTMNHRLSTDLIVLRMEKKLPGDVVTVRQAKPGKGGSM